MPTASPLVESPLPGVEIAHVSKTYSIAGRPIPILRDVSAFIRHGERVALLGKSGSGKSTLLNLLGGLDVPSSGTIRVAGMDLTKMSSVERARYRLHSVGMIFQSFYLIPTRTALENVELPMMFACRSVSERRAIALAALQAVHMDHRQEHHPNALSGGERQRVAIARALVNRPRLLLADEPTGNLDTATGREIMKLIRAYLERERATFLLVTHDEDLAAEYAERIIRLHDGQLAESSGRHSNANP